MHGGGVGWGALLLAALLAGCRAAPPAVAVALPATAQAGLETRFGPDMVRLSGDGTEVARRLVDAVSLARRSIDAEIYEFYRPDLVAAMAAATRRGVRVRVLMDPTVTQDAATAATLRAAGAAVWFFPDGQYQIDHIKLLVVDGVTAFFGGMNWGSRSYLNHDFELELHGPHAACLESIFAGDVAHSGGPAGGGLAPAPCAWSGVRVATTFPYAGIQPEVLHAIDGATGDVFLEMYVLTDAGAISALVRAAERGVAVRVLLDPEQPQNRVALQQLAGGGVVARFYRSGGELLHAKAMVVDGHVLVIGSANWSRSGFTRNHELDAVLDSPALAQAALRRMETDWRASTG